MTYYVMRDPKDAAPGYDIQPHIPHSSKFEAGQEAIRLARKYPNIHFLVVEVIGTWLGTVTVAAGDRYEAGARYEG